MELDARYTDFRSVRRLSGFRTFRWGDRMNDRLEIHTRFYRCLVVQNIFQHLRKYAETQGLGDRGQRGVLDTPRKKESTPWHVFLDSLSVLCDHEHGGKTVAAIAAESGSAAESKATFWIAVNHENPNNSIALRAREHLAGILQTLQQTTQKSNAIEGLMLEVFNTSVARAKNKVNHYRKKLQSLIASLKEDAMKLSSEETALLNAIGTLIDENKTVGSLCRKAYDFRLSRYACTLLKSARRGKTGLWKYVCHFVGRLGSWLKATCFLFENAAKFSDVLADCSVDVVPCDNAAGADLPPSMWELDSLLSQTLPANLAVSKDLLDHLFGTGAAAVATELLKTCEERGWRLKTHAEASMAQFFSLGNRCFVNEDRYIGCSKPSCTCCQLYLEFLPGGFERRPCHGNTWTQWRFPGLRLSAGSAEIEIMQRMANRLQREVEIEIISASRGHVFTHDSSTNMSSVFRNSNLR